jgi:hypothetical protein
MVLCSDWFYSDMPVSCGVLKRGTQDTQYDEIWLAEKREWIVKTVKKMHRLILTLLASTFVTGAAWETQGKTVFTFLNSHSGGWSPNWIHLARRPVNDLLYLPRVIMMMENLVEWILAGETEVLGENLPLRHLVHYKSHLTRPGLEPGPPRWEASD